MNKLIATVALLVVSSLSSVGAAQDTPVLVTVHKVNGATVTCTHMQGLTVCTRN